MSRNQPIKRLLKPLEIKNSKDLKIKLRKFTNIGEKDQGIKKMIRTLEASSESRKREKSLDEFKRSFQNERTQVQREIAMNQTEPHRAISRP